MREHDIIKVIGLEAPAVNFVENTLQNVVDAAIIDPCYIYGIQ